MEKREFRVREFKALPITGLGKRVKDGRVVSYYVRCSAGSIWSPEEPFFWRIAAEDAGPLLEIFKVTAESTWKAREGVTDTQTVWLENMPTGLMAPHGFGADIPFFADRQPAQHSSAIHRAEGPLKGLPVEQVSMRVYAPVEDLEIGANKEDIRDVLEGFVDAALTQGRWRRKQTLDMSQLLGGQQTTPTEGTKPAEGEDNSTKVADLG